MKLGKFSLAYIARVGIAAVLFILFFKWLAPRTGLQPLASAAAAV